MAILGWGRKRLDILEGVTPAQKLLFEGHNRGYWKLKVHYGLTYHPYIEKVIVRGCRSKLRYELKADGTRPHLYNGGFEFCSNVTHARDHDVGMLAMAITLRKNEYHFLQNARLVQAHTITGFFRGLYVTFLCMPFKLSIPLVILFCVLVNVLNIFDDNRPEPKKIEDPTKPGLTGSRIVSSPR